MYNGGFVTGGKTCLSEPLLTMNEQIGIAAEIARSVKVPLVMDAGAGWGEPLHTMRTVRECIWAGIAGVHIEDQLFPKRAHYHTYVVHNIPRDAFVDKIRLACKQRDELDKDFVIIARSDAARVTGLAEAIDRVNAAARVGADMGLVFPRTHDEAVATPKRAKLPMIYVQSRGTRDGRPLYSYRELRNMGYAGCIDATLSICVAQHFMARAMLELKKTGDYTGLSEPEFIAARKSVEESCRSGRVLPHRTRDSRTREAVAGADAPGEVDRSIAVRAHNASRRRPWRRITCPNYRNRSGGEKRTPFRRRPGRARSHTQDASDLGHVLTGLQAVGHGGVPRIVDRLTHAVQPVPHPMVAPDRRTEYVFQRLDLVFQALDGCGIAAYLLEITLERLDQLVYLGKIDFRPRVHFLLSHGEPSSRCFAPRSYLTRGPAIATGEPHNGGPPPAPLHAGCREVRAPCRRQPPR